jgi:hypothetical protein
MLMFLVVLLFFIRHPSETNALRQPRGGITMRYLSGRPVGAVNGHWRVLLPPNMSEKMMYEPGAKVKRMFTPPEESDLCRLISPRTT